MQSRKLAKGFLVVFTAAGILLAGGGGNDDPWRTLPQRASIDSITMPPYVSINEACAATICSAGMLAVTCYNVCTDVCRAKFPTDDVNKSICINACAQGKQSGSGTDSAAFFPSIYANACAGACRSSYGRTVGTNKDNCMDACISAKAKANELIAPCSSTLLK